MAKLSYPDTFNKLWAKSKVHPVIIVTSIVLTLLSALITVDTSSRLITVYIQQNLLWQSTEEGKLNKISPLQSIEYVKSVLGTPISSDKISDKYSSYTFVGRQNWVYVIYENDSEKSKYVAITACGDFHPTLNNNPGYIPIRLGITKLDSVNISTSATTWGETDHSLPDSKDRHYYIPGATGPLGIYEKHYLANPGRHETIYAGFNSSCGDQLPINSYILNKLANDDSGDTLSKKELDNFRANLSINTFAVMGSDKYDADLESMIDSDVEIGVKSKSVEQLLPPNLPSNDEINKIRNNH